MYYDEYANEMSLEDIAEVSTRNPYNWLKWLLLGFMILAPAAIAFSVSAELIAMCLLAYMNCLIIGFGVWRFLRKGTLAAMIPVLFVPYLLLAWPVATIYFAIFHPASAYYHVKGGDVSYFEAGVRVQLCVTLFITAYFSVMFIALRNKGFQDEGPLSNPRLLALVSLGMVSSIIFFHTFTRVVRLGGVLMYLVNVLYIHCYGLIFIVGALIKRLPVILIILGVAALGAAVFFYTIGNARGFALFPVALFFVGLLFFSDISRKTKIILVICVILFFPTYVVIANTTRVLLGTVGFEEGVAYRFKTLKQWREAKSERSAASFTFGRLFFTGGHSIISRTPSEHPYRYFLPQLFVREAFESLIPGVLYFRPYYRGTLILLDYGFTIVPGVTSVEVSMIGNLWLMGGYFPVFFGGITLGLLHWLLVWILRRSWAISKMKAFIYFSIFSHALFWAPNNDLIGHLHTVVYRIVLAFVLYHVMRLVIGEGKSMEYYVEEHAEAAVEERY